MDKMGKAFLLSITSLIFTLGCADKEPKEEPTVLPGWGESSYFINETLEEGIPELRRKKVNQDLYTFDVRRYNSEFFIRSEFSVYALTYSQITSGEKIRLLETDFSIAQDTTNATLYFFRSHGDVVTGVYTVIESDTIEDYIHFVDFDSSTNEVSGIFQGSFAVPAGVNPSLSGYGDTIIIRNGHFHTKLPE